ncbi:hypothetical protein BVRB_7g173830 isoform A [Beta vulgaris subsp. vulgaris]|nr:uncharacterized protein LOC104900109 isoform X3 [Beta vulgaris subsp. vulgaris]KMT05241.1 hypothetical protein BVRB_7g173830 isoform A [Beta vulgaris subsp. vulgaris]
MDSSWENINDCVVDNQKQITQIWPDWLPYDWCIHRNVHSSETQLYYSNPRGKKFQSQKEVIQYLAKQAQKRVIIRRTKRKIKKSNDMVENKELLAEIAPQYVAYPPQEWPEWLPQDWIIERSSKNPTKVYYCNPKWKKFRSKDEVLHHLETKSKKLRKKTKNPDLKS